MPQKEIWCQHTHYYAVENWPGGSRDTISRNPDEDDWSQTVCRTHWRKTQKSPVLHGPLGFPTAYLPGSTLRPGFSQPKKSRQSLKYIFLWQLQNHWLQIHWPVSWFWLLHPRHLGSERLSWEHWKAEHPAQKWVLYVYRNEDSRLHCEGNHRGKEKIGR